MTEYDLIYGYLIVKAIEFMKTEFDLFGHVVSYWQIFIMYAIVGIICLIIRGIFD